MGKTSIEWTQETWNPVRGCSRISPGCTNCYAERMAARGLPGMNSPTTGEPFAVVKSDGPHWTGNVELIPHMLNVPLKRRKPTTYFVNSMSDLFHEDMPVMDRRRVFVAMKNAPQHTYQILTKRAEIARDFCKWWVMQHVETMPSNWWLGVSVEDRQRKDRIEYLRNTPSAIRFLSIEPLLEDIGTLDLRGIHWVIVGGESGPGARPMHPEWARNLRDQCVSAGVPFLFKQWGEYVSVSEVEGKGSHFTFPDGATVRRVGKKAAGRMLDGRTWDEYPDVLREVPA